MGIDMEAILTNENNTELKYVVLVNGVEVSARYTTPQAAEATLEHLSEAHRSIAEIVSVTDDGNQLLLG